MLHANIIKVARYSLGGILSYTPWQSSVTFSYWVFHFPLNSSVASYEEVWGKNGHLLELSITDTFFDDFHVLTKHGVAGSFLFQGANRKAR